MRKIIIISSMKKAIFVLLFLGIFLLVSCQPSSDDTVSVDRGDLPEPTNENLGFAGISKKQCEQANGLWNECGSPCAGTDADFCIEICQVQCECGGIAGFNCPEGYKCRLTGKIADEIGVCVKK